MSFLRYGSAIIRSWGWSRQLFGLVSFIHLSFDLPYPGVLLLSTPLDRVITTLLLDELSYTRFYEDTRPGFSAFVRLVFLFFVQSLVSIDFAKGGWRL